MMISLDKYIYFFFKLAIIAFISHGFLDFWPIFQQWKWQKSLSAYIIMSISGVYLYAITPSIVIILFFLFSTYHFGSDWDKSYDAIFLGSCMVGIATYQSSIILKEMGIPYSIMFGTIFAISGIISLLPSIKNKAVYFMFPLSFFGIYGVMFYAIFIHTPRSVYLLANKYGNIIYTAWIFITILLYLLSIFLENTLQYFEISFSNDILMGLVFGILFAHMMCTAGWREYNKKLLS